MELPEAVVWRSEELGIISGAFIHLAAPDTDLRAISAAAIQDLTSACDGDVASSSHEVDWGAFPARQVRLLCKGGETDYEAFRNIMLLDGLIVETLVSFLDGEAVPRSNNETRTKLNKDASIIAASYFLE